MLLLLMVCACSNTPVRIESRALADQVSRSPEHFIIAAVANEPAPLRPRRQHAARLRRHRNLRRDWLRAR
jgi:hypothetical protein